MTAPVRGQSQYDYRLALVVAVILDKTELSREDAVPLAASVLHVVDHIPERVR